MSRNRGTSTGFRCRVRGTTDRCARRTRATSPTTDGTRADGPVFNPLNLETQINDQFVDWGPYDTNHHYSYWIMGDGNPINMRVFDGDPATNTPRSACWWPGR